MFTSDWEQDTVFLLMQHDYICQYSASKWENINPDQCYCWPVLNVLANWTLKQGHGAAVVSTFTRQQWLIIMELMELVCPAELITANQLHFTVWSTYLSCYSTYLYFKYISSCLNTINYVFLSQIGVWSIWCAMMICLCACLCAHTFNIKINN